MKKMILIGLLTVSSTSFAAELLDVEGKIKSVTTGEFDPFVIGDACLIEIKNKSETLALLTDFDDCNDYGIEGKLDETISLVVNKKDRVKKKSELEILADHTSAVNIYRVEFSKIEEALAK